MPIKKQCNNIFYPYIIHIIRIINKNDIFNHINKSNSQIYSFLTTKL